MGPLTADDLLHLADAMLKRGVQRFNYTTGEVEFHPQTILRADAAKQKAEAQKLEEAKRAEVTNLVAYEKKQAEDRETQRIRDALGSA